MRLQPLGPQAMQARMAEIRQKMGLNPTHEDSPVFQIPQDHGPAAGPLQGQITQSGSFAPFNPMGPGASVQSSATPASLKALIEKAASDNGVDPALLDALVAQESSYNPAAVSSKRAVGLTQLMPDTARGLGVTDPFDPAQNLQGGAKYLSQMLKRFNGNVESALAAYNAGPGAVQRYGGVPPYKETQDYVRKIISHYQGGRS